MKKPRMIWTAILAAVTLAGVVFVHPQQAGIILVKFNILALAGWLGYWLDRELFPYARPHESKTNSLLMLRRSIVVAAAMLSASLAI